MNTIIIFFFSLYSAKSNKVCKSHNIHNYTEACSSTLFPSVVKVSGQQTGFWVIPNAQLKVKFQPKIGVAEQSTSLHWSKANSLLSN